MAKKPKYESDDEVVVNLDAIAVPGAIVLAGVIVAVAIFLSNKNSTGEVDDQNTDNVAGEETETPDTAPDTAEFPDASTDIADGPYLGDKDSATVAIVEYNEFRCGFCKRHLDETFPGLKENYIDTGKIIYVFREFAIYGDDIANAAKCVYHLEGTDTYVEFHKNAFNLEDEDAIYDLAKSVGVNEGDFDSCYSSTQYQDEIDADKAAGSSAGVQGTPGFVIGTLDSDGNVDGILIPGAYPYETFAEKIESFL
jgi:protein-disulfide isomerase